MAIVERGGAGRRFVVGAILALSMSGAVPAGSAVGDGNWPQFRGPDNRGVVDSHPLPERWDVTAGAGLLWKTAVPGLGLSAPVIWGDRIFITSAIGGTDEALKIGLYGDISSVEDDTKHRFQVLAIDKRTGKLLWTRTAHEGVPKIKRHLKSSHANPSVATDGTHVIASFGSEGLYAYDMQGKLLWKKDLGLLDSGFFEVPSAQWGFGSSPIIHDGLVIVQADVQKDSFLAAYDVATGEERWKTTRSDVPTWSTPTVHVGADRSQVLVNGWKHAGGYDLKTGEELWKMATIGDIPAPTPYVAHDLVFLTNAHGAGIAVYAIKISATGDISLDDDQTSNEYVAWSDPRGGSYMPTTVVYGDELYVLRDNGILSCRDARTGELHYKERVGFGDGFTASLVAGDGKIYLTAETGEVAVVKAGKSFEKLAVNALDEVCMSAPAISKGQLYFRTRHHLIAIGKATPKPKATSPKPAKPAEGEVPGAGRWREARSAMPSGAEVRDAASEAEYQRLLALGYVTGSQEPSGHGVSIHDESRAFEGFNFYTSAHDEVAVLMDMQGNVVHEWRKSLSAVLDEPPPTGDEMADRWWRRAWLLENGDVIALNTGVGIMRLDRDSKVEWATALYVHHDLAFRDDGGYIVLTRDVHVIPRIQPKQPIIEDTVTYLNAKGEVERRLSVLEAFERSPFKDEVFGSVAPRKLYKSGDLFHTNAVVLLDGKLADRHPAFAAGNLLLSFRPLDAIGILDPKTETMIWYHKGEFAKQHDPRILPDGNLLLFDNRGLHDASRILELDPIGGDVQWRYVGSEEAPFYSHSCGTSQALPNGNVLITESDNGRAFEVTRSGDIVWEYFSPHRAGDEDQFVATLPDVTRIPKDFPLGWLKE